MMIDAEPMTRCSLVPMMRPVEGRATLSTDRAARPGYEPGYFVGPPAGRRA
jgi:hypothetical protein